MSKKPKKDRVLSFKYLMFDFIRITALPGVLFFRPKKIFISEKAKQKIKGGALIISNHSTLFDPMYLLMLIWYRRLHFVAMNELFGSKFRKWIFTKWFCCIEINRENFSLNSFKDIVNRLNRGQCVGIFPEGKVNEEKDGGFQAFKSGMIMMALKSKTPIVPLYIKKRKHWYSRLECVYGEPVNIVDFIKDDKVTMNDINNASKYLEEQENKLRQIAEGGK